MVNQPRRTSVEKPGPHRSRPDELRRKVVLEVRPLGVITSLMAGLKLLGERSASVVGDAYALVAGSVQDELERIEDLNAERRFRQRAKVKPSGSAPGAAPARQLKSSLHPHK